MSRTIPQADFARHTSSGKSWWAALHWNAVLNARQDTPSEPGGSLDDLCRGCWHPLFAYIRRRGYEVEEARDLTQEFFTRLLLHHWLEQADPTRGNFRSFLLSSLNHFLANEWRRAHAAKRGGGSRLVRLDDFAEERYAEERASDSGSNEAIDRQWLLELFEAARERLRRQYVEAGHGRLFDSLSDYLSSEPQDGDYHRLGAQLGMSHGAVSTAVCRLRQRCRELIREEIGREVSNPSQVDEELRALRHALA